METVDCVALLLAVFILPEMSQTMSVSWKTQPLLRKVACQENDFIVCNDCTNQLLCDGEYEIPCSEGKICEEIEGFGVCVDEKTSNSECVCPHGENGYIPDLYDESKYHICIDDGRRFMNTCGEGEKFSSGTYPPCVATTTVTTTTIVPPDVCDLKDPGNYPIEGSCDSLLLCTGTDKDPIIHFCQESERYSEEKNNCVPESELTVDPFSCPPTGLGVFADPLNCGNFYYCNDGTMQKSSCPSEMAFDIFQGCTVESDCKIERCVIASDDSSTTSTSMTYTDSSIWTNSPSDISSSVPSTITSSTSTSISTSTPSITSSATPTITPSSTSSITPSTTHSTTVTTTSSSTTTTTSSSTISTTHSSTSSTTSPQPTTPVCNIEGKHPFPGSCQKYYVCEMTSMGEMIQTVETCPDSLIFDPTKELCVSQSDYPCSVTQPPPTNEPGSTKPICKSEGIFPFKGNCWKYYTCEPICDDEVFALKVYKCPGLLVFDPNQAMCVSTSDYQCTT